MWPFTFLFFFSVGRIAYSLIPVRNWRQGIIVGVLEVATASIFIGVGWRFAAILSPTYRGGALGALFFVTSLLGRLAYLDRKVRKTGSLGHQPGKLFCVGVIDGTWLFVMSAAVSFVGFASASQLIADPIPAQGYSATYYQQYFQAASFFLEKVINGVFALGAALAVSMSILWSGDWSPQTAPPVPQDKVLYYLKNSLSLKMICGFFVAAFGCLVWIAVPLHNRMMAVLELIKASH